MVKKTCQRSLYTTPYQGQNHHSWAVHSVAAVEVIAVSAGLAWTNPLSKNKSIIELVLRALCSSKCLPRGLSMTDYPESSRISFFVNEINKYIKAIHFLNSVNMIFSLREHGTCADTV